MGAVCASFSVECLGTQEHYFTHEEYWQRYHKTFDA
jgi:adenosine kinase